MTLKQRILDYLMDPNITLLLLVIGALAIYVEFQTPGAVIPGTIGFIAVLLAIFALHLLPTSFAGVALILGAFVLFALEAKFQTHGVLTIGATGLLILGALARRFLHLLGGGFAVLTRLVRLLRTRIGLLAREPVLELLHLVAQAIRPVGELTRLVLLRVVRLVAGGFGAVGQLPVAIGDVFRFILERLHGALECGALEHLGAFLELLA